MLQHNQSALTIKLVIVAINKLLLIIILILIIIYVYNLLITMRGGAINTHNVICYNVMKYVIM